MVGGITDFKGLREAIYKMVDSWLKMQDENFSEYNTGVIRGLRNTLDKISEFEAGVRPINFTEDELKLLEGWTVGYLYASQELSNKDYDKMVTVVEKCKKLRRVLGEGERVEKAKKCVHDWYEDVDEFGTKFRRCKKCDEGQIFDEEDGEWR